VVVAYADDTVLLTAPEEINGNRGGVKLLRKGNRRKVEHCKLPRPSGWLQGHNEESYGYTQQHRNKGTWRPYGKNDGEVGDIQMVADYQDGVPPGT